jgi:hypothetical protein
MDGRKKERSMRNKKAKIAAAATAAGLAGLGGVALGTNHGMPSGAQVASRGGAPLVTTASGATAQPATLANGTTRPPIVTRTSGSGLIGQDD